MSPIARISLIHGDCALRFWHVNAAVVEEERNDEEAVPQALTHGTLDRE